MKTISQFYSHSTLHTPHSTKSLHTPRDPSLREGLPDVIPRALLPRIEITMPHNQRLGVALLQIFKQHFHGTLLRLCTCVFGTTLSVESALVAHADGVLVVVLAVSANLLLRPPRPDHTFAVDIVMVADVLEPAMRYVVAPTFRECEPLPLRGGRAVDDNQCNGSHSLLTHRIRMIAVRGLQQWHSGFRSLPGAPCPRCFFFLSFF